MLPGGASHGRLFLVQPRLVRRLRNFFHYTIGPTASTRALVRRVLEETMPNPIKTNKYGYQQSANLERGQQGQQDTEKPVRRAAPGKSRSQQKPAAPARKPARAKR